MVIIGVIRYLKTKTTKLKTNNKIERITMI